MIDAGTYRARAVKGSEEYGETSSGDAKMAIKLELLDIGETVTTYLYFSTKARPYAEARLVEMGWDGTDSMDGLGSRECTARITHEEYPAGSGTMKMKVDVVTQGQGGISEADKMSDRKKKAFLAKLAGKPEPGGALM